MLPDGLERCRWRWRCVHVGEPYEMILEAHQLTENSGVLILFGGLLLVISSILEFVIGNTFPCVVFGHLGKATSKEKSS